MGIVFLDGQCFDLVSKLDRIGDILPVSSASESKLCAALGETGHTYLTIKSPTGNEIVKATCVDGDIVIERAQGGTSAQTHSTGRCACFVVNKPILDDYIEEAMLGGCKPKVVSGDADYLVVTEDEDTCTFTISMNEDFKEMFEGCCGADDCDPCVLPDGVYENATLTIRGGKVCGVSNGTNIVYTGGSLCSCADNG